MTNPKIRREEFISRIQDGAALFPAAPVAIRNGDVEHEYRQDTDFYYLTGLEEPGSVAVIVPDHPEHRFVLFVQPKDREKEVWTGWRTGTEGAIELYGADAAFTTDKLDEELPKLIGKADRLYYRFGSDPDFDVRVVGLMRRFQRERQRSGFGPSAVVDPGEALHHMRLVKNPEELARLRRAVEITTRAHVEAMEAARPGLYEYEVEAVIRYSCLKEGSRRQGYPSIVASGPNATVLHYTANNRKMADGDLLLIDAGAEFDYFTADVTRTFPVGGRFSDAQASIYNLVLEAERRAIAAVKPGARFVEPHERAVEVLVEGLLRLGLLEGEPEKLIEESAYKKFYMHRTSHWLGMDVHDAGPYREGDEWRKLEPGMVLTIEPGLYFPEVGGEDDPEVDERFRGIGVRIEDDILVTESGAEVLSIGVPKEVADIERLKSGARK